MSHSLSRVSRFWSVFIVVIMLLVIVLAAGPSLAPSSQAEGAPYTYLPGYGPRTGCVDVAVGGVGMFPDGAGTINLDVPGPVLDAWLVWTGTQDETKGVVTDPEVSDLDVNGTTVIGHSQDMLPIHGDSPTWYNYFADVGPTGYNIVNQGGNTLNLSGWGPLFSSVPEGRGTKRNGASLVVVYDTSPCTRANAVYVYNGFDFAWWTDEEFGTGVISHLIEPSAGERSGRLVTSIAGIDHTQVGVGLCRGIRMWYEQGSGPVPNVLFERLWPESVGVNGGMALADDIWNPIPPCTPDYRAPATDLSGGYSGNGGDYGVAELKITVPAGATHVAYQLESERPTPDQEEQDPEFLGGESFTWIGAGSPFVIEIPTPDMAVTKTDGVDTAQPGEQLTYTIDYANVGDGVAEDVVIKDTLPDYVTFVSASDGGTEAGGVVTWNLGTVPAGANGAVTMVVEIDSLFPVAGIYDLLNTVVISTSSPDVNPDNDTDTDLTKVPAAPKLMVTKAAAPEPVPAGQQLTYTIKWNLTGSAPGKDLKLTDSVPDDTTFVSASDGGTESGGVVTWSLGDKNPGASGSVTMIVAVDSPLLNGLKIPNTVVFSDNGSPVDIPDATDTVTSTVVSEHTLDLTKTAVPDEVEPGEQITYTLDWSVDGNGVAPGLMLIDALPEGTTFISASDGGVYDAPNVVWDLGDTNPPASGTVSFMVAVDDDLPVDTESIANTATLCDDDADTECATDSTETPVVIPEKSTIGDDVFEDLNDNGVRDPGEPGIDNATVELLSPGADGVCGTADDAVLDTTTTDSDGKYLFTVEAGTYCVAVDDATIPGGLVLGDSFANPHGPIVVAAGESYLNADFGYVPDETVPRVRITKTDSPDPVTAGELLEFTLSYSVEGEVTATEVVITDEVPDGTSFVSASNGGTESGGVVTWQLGTLVPPASGSVTMVVRVDADTPSGSVIHNEAVITSKEGGSDRDTSTTDVIGVPDLALRKSASTMGPVVLDQVYTYELCYQNTGGADALNTVLVDDLPAAVDYVDGTASNGGVYDSGARQLTWNIGTLSPGPEACVTFDVKVVRAVGDMQADASGVVPFRVWSEVTIRNTATIDASNTDSVTVEHELPMTTPVNLTIFKAVDKSQVVAGEEIEYTVSVTNEGTATATDVVVTDELSVYLENIRVTTSQGSASYDPMTHTVIVELGSLAPGASATITIRARVVNNDEVCDMAPFTFLNSAVVSFTEGTPVESNIVQVTVDCPPPNEIPEPGTILLLGSGLLGLAGWARRRRRLQNV